MKGISTVLRGGHEAEFVTRATRRVLIDRHPQGGCRLRTRDDVQEDITYSAGSLATTALGLAPRLGCTLSLFRIVQSVHRLSE